MLRREIANSLLHFDVQGPFLRVYCVAGKGKAIINFCPQGHPNLIRLVLTFTSHLKLAYQYAGALD